MKGIVSILESATALTGLLSAGVGSVFHGEATQDAGVPHVIVDIADMIPVDSMNGVSNTDEYQVRVFSVCETMFSNGGNAGSEEVAEAVRTAIDNVSGTYDSDNIADIRLESSSTYNETNGGSKRVVFEQIYEVYKTR